MPDIFQAHADRVAKVQTYCSNGPVMRWNGTDYPCSVSGEVRDGEKDFGGATGFLTRSVTILANLFGSTIPGPSQTVTITPRTDATPETYRIRNVTLKAGGTLLQLVLETRRKDAAVI